MRNKQNMLEIIKVNDICLATTKYELRLNGVYYTSNISRKLKDKYVDKFRSQGYNIVNGVDLEELYE